MRFANQKAGARGTCPAFARILRPTSLLDRVKVRTVVSELARNIQVHVGNVDPRP